MSTSKPVTIPTEQKTTPNVVSGAVDKIPAVDNSSKSLKPAEEKRKTSKVPSTLPVSVAAGVPASTASISIEKADKTKNEKVDKTKNSAPEKNLAKEKNPAVEATEISTNVKPETDNIKKEASVSVKETDKEKKTPLKVEEEKLKGKADEKKKEKIVTKHVEPVVVKPGVKSNKGEPAKDAPASQTTPAPTPTTVDKGSDKTTTKMLSEQEIKKEQPEPTKTSLEETANKNVDSKTKGSVFVLLIRFFYYFYYKLFLSCISKNNLCIH